MLVFIRLIIPICNKQSVYGKLNFFCCNLEPYRAVITSSEKRMDGQKVIVTKINQMTGPIA